MRLGLEEAGYLSVEDMSIGKYLNDQLFGPRKCPRHSTQVYSLRSYGESWDVSTRYTDHVRLGSMIVELCRCNRK